MQLLNMTRLARKVSQQGPRFQGRKHGGGTAGTRRRLLFRPPSGRFYPLQSTERRRQEFIRPQLSSLQPQPDLASPAVESRGRVPLPRQISQGLPLRLAGFYPVPPESETACYFWTWRRPALAICRGGGSSGVDVSWSCTVAYSCCLQCRAHCLSGLPAQAGVTYVCQRPCMRPDYAASPPLLLRLSTALECA